MNVLILGSGGREHALAWKIAQSSSCNKLFIAPGNAGTDFIGKNENINVTDFDAIKKLVLFEEIEMVVVGPEDPLVKGIYDFFKNDNNLVISSAIFFSITHILFLNFIAPILSFIGGLLFANTYNKHRSLLLVSIEHGLYGNTLFFIGLGWYFWGGSLSY